MESLENRNTRCDGLWVGEVLKNYSQGPCQSRRNEDENPQDLSHGAIGLHLSPDQRTIPPLRRRQASWFILALKLLRLSMLSGIILKLKSRMNA